MIVEIPSVAVGAIVAATIGAAVTLLGLIISKESKTSEFRQAWIDGLREEIKSLLVAFNSVADASHRKFDSHDEKLNYLLPLFNELNSSVFAVSLRLNPEEARSKKLIEDANELVNLARSPGPISPDAIRPLETSLQNSAKKLLKYEWKRVKRGEPFFFCLKWGALAALIALAVVSNWVFVGGFPVEALNASPAASIKLPPSPSPSLP
ncbi:hypothetical protein [Alteriqipengyuania lutimaris]|uniref:hypothetical protein n=1 Tax=Alteriqipengyuania lutimaris TaxID=1538146 RepID=UPI001CFF4971|nr:hypothetical protein [Alteriqipengyuania lutimaris]